MSNQRQYGRAEVEEILKRAVSHQHSADNTSHAELLEVAAELGVDASHLEAAAAEVSEETREAQATQAMQKRRRGRFLRTAVLMGFVNAFLVALNTWLPDGIGALTWSRIPLLVTALVLAVLGLRAFTPRDDDADRYFQLEAKKERKRMRRRQALPGPGASASNPRVRVAQDGEFEQEARSQGAARRGRS